VGVVAGLYKSVPEACEATVKVVTHQAYQEENHQKYEGYYKLYTTLYTSLKNDFKTLAGLQG